MPNLRRVSVALLMGLTFTTIATRADAQNTIYACVNNSSGAVKIVAAGTVCPNNQSLVTWNIVGPQGAQGPQGPQGPQGVVANLSKTDGGCGAENGCGFNDPIPPY